MTAREWLDVLVIALGVTIACAVASAFALVLRFTPRERYFEDYDDRVWV